MSDDDTHSPSTRAPSYALTPAQQALLAGDTDLGATPGTRLATIRDHKVIRLNQRLCHLFDDVALLDHAQFFEPDWTGDLWERVQTHESPWAAWNWADHWETLLETEPDWASVPAPFISVTSDAGARRQFGAHLGQMVRRLSTSVLDDAGRLDIVMGFLRGLMFPPNAARYESADTPSPDHLRELLQRLAERGNIAHHLEQQQATALKTIQETRRRHRELAADALTNEGITSTDPVRDVVLEEADLPSPFLGSLSTEPDQAPTAIETTVQDLLDATNLRRLDQLADRVNLDLKTLQATEIQGQDPCSILSDLSQAASPQSVREIGSKDLAGPIHATLYRLSEANPDLECLTTAPLVTRRDDAWTTTAYGDLVSECLDLDGDPRDTLHKVALSGDSVPDGITALIPTALAEVNPEYPE